jgi:BirA family biotin operon repressor/biotin-[acetyl-CoA-carboxylase] ligase
MSRLSRTAVQRDLRTRWVGRELIYRVRTTSTMDDARDAADRGLPDGTVIVAEEQTAGRGRKRDRRWVSPPGQNLYFTILLRPDLERARRMSIVMPVAIANAVEQLLGVYPRIKWPNDLRLRGRKFVGILTEAEWKAGVPEYVLSAAGVNVNFDPGNHSADIEQAATSLALERGRPLDREAVLSSILNAFERAYEGALSDALFEGWRSRSETLGRQVTVTQDNGRTLDGIAEDLDADGALLVRTPDGTLHPLHAGEVSVRALPVDKP